MTNLIKIITATVFALFTFNTFANTSISSPTKFTKATTVIDTYIESVLLGKPENSEYIFAQDFQQRIIGNKDSKITKNQLVKFLKSQKGFIQNCQSEYQIIESGSNYAIAKVKMKYNNFTRTDYVNMTLKNGSWEINQVEVSYFN